MTMIPGMPGIMVRRQSVSQPYCPEALPVTMPYKHCIMHSR
jgi:hypothetical protein